MLGAETAACLSKSRMRHRQEHVSQVVKPALTAFMDPPAFRGSSIVVGDMHATPIAAEQYPPRVKTKVWYDLLVSG